MLLVAALTGSGNPVAVVYDHDTEDWQNDAPAVFVIRTGTDRTKEGIGTSKWRTSIILQILVVVPDADEANNWTPQLVDDTLDDIGTSISNVVGDNERHEPYWTRLMFVPGQYSVVIPIKKMGKTYKQENFLLQLDPIRDP